MIILKDICPTEDIISSARERFEKNLDEYVEKEKTLLLCEYLSTDNVNVRACAYDKKEIKLGLLSFRSNDIEYKDFVDFINKNIKHVTRMTYSNKPGFNLVEETTYWGVIDMNSSDSSGDIRMVFNVDLDEIKEIAIRFNFKNIREITRKINDKDNKTKYIHYSGGYSSLFMDKNLSFYLNLEVE